MLDLEEILPRALSLFYGAENIPTTESPRSSRFRRGTVMSRIRAVKLGYASSSGWSAHPNAGNRELHDERGSKEILAAYLPGGQDRLDSSFGGSLQEIGKDPDIGAGAAEEREFDP